MHPVLASLFQIQNVAPDFSLIWLSVLCLQYRRRACTGWGFTLGFLTDLMGGGTLGVHAFSMSIAGYIGSVISGAPHQEHPFSIRITMMAVLSLQNTTTLLLFRMTETEAGLGVLLLRYGLPAIIYTLLAGLAVHGVSAILETRHRDAAI